jgi:hypothetical protein
MGRNHIALWLKQNRLITKFRVTAVNRSGNEDKFSTTIVIWGVRGKRVEPAGSSETSVSVCRTDGHIPEYYNINKLKLYFTCHKV